MADDTDFDPRSSAVTMRSAPSDTSSSSPPPTFDPKQSSILGTSFGRVPSDAGGDGSVWDTAARRLGLGARAAAEGIGGVVGGVGDVLTWPGRAIGKAIGYTPPAWQSDFYTSPSQQIQNAINATGLPTPRTPGEQTTSTAVQGAASTLPFLVAGVPSATQMIAQPLAGAIGAIAGKAAAESPRVPESLKPAAAAVANLLAGGASAGLAGRLANAATGTTSQIMQAFDRQGVTPRTPGMLMQPGAEQAVEGTLARLPGGAASIAPKIRRTVDEFGQAVDDTAARLAPQATTPEATGEAAQDAIRSWRYDPNNPNGFLATQDRLYAPVNARMAGQMVDPAPYRAALDNAARDPALAARPDIQQQFARQQIQQHLDALNQNAPPGTMMTWEEMQAIRRNWGDMLATPEIQQSLDPAAQRSVYGGIAQSLQNAANGRGVGQQFADANAYSTYGHNFIDQTLSKAVRTQNPGQDINPAVAADRLLNSDDTSLRLLRANIPDAADALAAYKLRQSRMAQPSQSGATGTETSANTYLTQMNQLRRNRPGAFGALYGADPAVSQDVADQTAIASQLRNISKYENVSGSGGAAVMGAAVPMAAWTGFQQGGIPGAIAYPAGLLGAPYVAGQLAANPVTRWYLGGQRAPKITAPLLGEALSQPARRDQEP